MSHLIVRDRKTGQPIPIPKEAIPMELHPDNWFENAYWRQREDQGELGPLIRKLYSDKTLTAREVKKLAQYIVDYAAHIAIAAWIFTDTQKEKDAVFRLNVEALSKLRTKEDEAETEEDIREMIQIGMEYAIDPF